MFTRFVGANIFLELRKKTIKLHLIYSTDSKGYRWFLIVEICKAILIINYLNLI